MRHWFDMPMVAFFMNTAILKNSYKLVE
jgi:hypothetical protein